jgi:hypothetical protein
LNLPHYPRTLHIGDSGGGGSKHAASFEQVAGKHLIVEEKVDGSHCGLFFDEDAELILFSRKTVLESPPTRKDFVPLYQMAMHHLDGLWDVLEQRYVLYGEWALATHSIFYDALPAFFLEDDIYDRERDAFLSTKVRHALVATLPLAFRTSVDVLAAGAFNELDSIRELIGPSHYKTPDWRHHLCKETLANLDDTDLGEGLYIKHEEDGIVQGRYKWVRPEFIQRIVASGSHWRNLPLLKNCVTTRS